jgi:F-type H+-transporting ATPase subunit b
MLAVFGSILAQAEEQGGEVSEAKDLIPAPAELLVGFLAFLVLFYFTWKWLLPRFRQVLDERREQIQGQLERSEATRKEAEKLLEKYRQQLAQAREEANRIIDEARSTADALRRDLQTKAEEQAQATVARAQDEIRAERDRAFQELRAQVGAIAVELAGRVVGESLDRDAHQRLIDDYLDQVVRSGGNGSKGRRGSDGS